MDARNAAVVLGAVLTLVAPPALASDPLSTEAKRGSRGGAVYAMTNDVEANAVVTYARASDGMLTLVGTVATGGQGGIVDPPHPVDALGSQNSLILSANNKWLFAVNAGSDEISVFRVRRSGLKLVDKVDSGGNFPVSLTLHKRLLYVLNSGGDGNITGFTWNKRGHLAPLAGSTRSLNVGGTNPPSLLASPGQVGFSPRGKELVVTVKGSNEIYVFPVDDNGLPGEAPVSNISNGFTPFGFAFDRRGHLISVEAFGTGPQPPPPTSDTGAASSYRLERDGSLQVISGSVGNFQTAACWLITDRRGRYAYTTNNTSGTISGYRIRRNGELSLLNADGVAAETGNDPVDLAITKNRRFLYAVNAGDGTVSMFRVNRWNGSLTALGTVGGLPVYDGAAGIAVR